MSEDKKIDWGGPAFPELGNVGYKSDWQSENGMTLRDWFAGQALGGQLAFSPHDSFGKYNQPDEVAAACYRFADAMIAVRNGGSSNG